MTENWAAVSDAIRQRLAETGMSQRALTHRAGVSTAIIRELQNNTVQRRRSARTLQAISVALNWEPDHLAGILGGTQPPTRPTPALKRSICDPDHELSGRLAEIENQLRAVIWQLAAISDNIEVGFYGEW